MKIFESLFDVIYLSVLVALGVRLLLEKNKGAKLFGVMAIVLGFTSKGDFSFESRRF